MIQTKQTLNLRVLTNYEGRVKLTIESNEFDEDNNRTTYEVYFRTFDLSVGGDIEVLRTMEDYPTILIHKRDIGVVAVCHEFAYEPDDFKELVKRIESGLFWATYDGIMDPDVYNLILEF